MPSIITGYEYDIFISYRQNDNRSGWVTEFVAALQEELAAAIKDSVSVYFDTNPNDGLLETHLIDKSLENKLKCLIFIPVISQTYCDPKSFAWQNEFIAFNKASHNDSIGGSIKLSNGNVSGRMLPVKIHDLDIADISLLESELGGPIRSVEFIFRSPGVNRSLKPDDLRSENLNHTYYRDQINKVANAVKEIIISLRFPDSHYKNIEEGRKDSIKSGKHSKKNKFKIAFWTLLMVLLAILGFFLAPVLSRNSTEQIDKSIAVLPFDNLSNDPDQEYFSDGMTEEILDHLYKIGDLRVTARTTSMKYKASKLSAREIALELGVFHILEGSVRKQGEKVKIVVKLIDSKNDILWLETYERNLNDILAIQSEVAQQVATKLKAKISPELEDRIDRISTTVPEAYDLYLRGLNKLQDFWLQFDIAHVDTAQNFFERAIELDPQFSMAYAQLGASWWHQGHWSRQPSPYMYHESIRNLRKAIDLDPLNGVAYANLAVVEHNWLWDKESARKSLETALTLMPNSEEVWSHLMTFFWVTGDCDKLRTQIPNFENRFKQAAWPTWKAGMLLCQGKVEEALASDPENMIANLVGGKLSKAKEISNPEKYNFSSISYMVYGLALVKGKQIDSAVLLLRKLEDLEKIRYVNPTIFAAIYKALGNDAQADKYIEKAFAVRDNMLHWIMLFGPYHDLKNDPKVKEIIARSWVPLKE